MKHNRTAGLFVLYALFTATSAIGQQVADDNSAEISIEAQRLDLALNELAQQSGFQLLTFSEDALDKTAKSLNGILSDEQALDLLLEGTGLTYREIEEDVIAVGSPDRLSARFPGNSRPASNPTLVAQNRIAAENRKPPTQIPANASGSTNDDNATSVVTGKVTDARTGANLKGAKVTIEETGRWTSTNDLGEFRFVNVPTGSATLTVSYLGYAGQSTVVGVRGDSVSQSFALRGGSEVEEIVVFGQRSARALSLNRERTAENTQTVLSADMLGNFNGTTISEALRRAPGIAFVPDSDTGAGANIIVRGLEPDLNQIQFNGLRLLDGSGVGRSPDLSNLLTESIESVTINKTLLPSQDSNGAGALVEIETKSPLDRDRRFASFGVEYGWRGNDFGDSFQGSGTLSGIFGSDEDFGLSVSASYLDEEVTRVDYSLSSFIFGPYLPAGAANTGQIDPRLKFPFEEGVDKAYVSSMISSEGSTEQETLSVTFSAQKQFGRHTDWRFDYTRNEQNTSTYRASTTPSVRTSYVRSPGPIEELDGELRHFVVTEDALAPFGREGIFGNVRRNTSYSPNEENTSNIFSFRGETNIDQWSLNYSLGHTRSEQTRDQSFSIGVGAIGRGSGFFTPINLDDLDDSVRNNTRNGLVVSIFDPLEPGRDPGFILPRFNTAGFEFYNSVETVPFTGAREDDGGLGRGDASHFEVSVRRSFDIPLLTYVEFGANYQSTEFLSSRTTTAVSYNPVDGVGLNDLGLAFDTGILTRVGASADFASLTRESVEAFISNLDDLSADGLVESVESDRSRFLSPNETREDNLAYYLQARFDWGNFEVIGGVRVDRLDLESNFFFGPSVLDENGDSIPNFRETYGRFSTERARQTDILPRVNVNYRFSDNLVLRSAYGQTVSRPQLANLTQRSEPTLGLEPRFGPNDDQPFLFISRGNPELEPAVTHNFDVAWEWFFDDIGVLKANGFFKLIKNPLQSNQTISNIDSLPPGITIPDIPFFNDLPDDLFVSISQAVNGEDDFEIWGAELVAERQFTFLPGVFSGLGVYANYTYTDSSGVQRINVGADVVPEGFVEFDGVPFEGSPKHSGTGGLTYSGYGFDASLLYSIQARRLAEFRQFFLHNFDEQIETLDLRIDYITDIAGAEVRVFLRGTDLLRGDDEPYLRRSVGGDGGVPKYYTGGTYFGGRSFFLGLRTSF